MTPKRTAQPWMAYVGVFLAVAGFVGGLANAWYSLRERVTVLEQREHYLHGDFQMPEAK